MQQQAWVQLELGNNRSALATAERAASLDPYSPSTNVNHIKILCNSYRYEDAERAALAAIDRCPAVADLPNELGLVYAAQDKDEEALRWFRRAKELNPNDDDCVLNVARALRWLHRLQEAEDLIRKSGQSKPAKSSHMLELGIVLERQGKYDEALDVYRTAANSSQYDVGAWISLIGLLRDQRRLSEAKKQAQKAIEHNPLSVELRIALVQVCDAAGDEEAGIHELRRAQQDLPHESIPLYHLAARLIDQAKVDEALALLSRVPHYALATLRRVWLLGRARRYISALEALDAEIAKRPDDVDLCLTLGEIQLDSGRDEEALATFESVMAANPFSVRARRGYVKSLVRLRRFSEAEIVLIEEADVRTNYVDCALDLGEVYKRTGREDESLAVYKQHLEADPRDLNCLFAHANTLRMMSRFDDAEAALVAALEARPYAVSLLVEMGELLDDLNRYDEALEWFDRAAAVAPLMVSPLLAKSATLRALGRLAEAERVLQPALLRRPANRGLLIEWGWVLYDRGELTRAQHVFQKTHQLARNYAQRADTLRCMGWVALKKKNFSLARDRFSGALKEDRHSIDAKLGMAWTLVQMGELEGET